MRGSLKVCTARTAVEKTLEAFPVRSRQLLVADSCDDLMHIPEVISKYHLLTDTGSEVLVSIGVQSGGGKKIQHPAQGFVLNLGGSEDVKDCSCEEVFRGVDEVLLVLALCSCFILWRGEDVRDDLRIPHGILTRANLGEDIEVNGVFDDGAESEGVGELTAKPCGDMPILRFWIKDDYAAAPGKKGRDDSADPLARSAWRHHKRGGLSEVADDPGGTNKAVLGSACSGVSMQDGSGRLSADDAFFEKKPVMRQIADCRPSGCAVEVVVSSK